MNRTQKKCFVASTGFHLLLIAILFIGPAFLSSKDPLADMEVIEFIPMLTTDKPFTGGGSPTASTPPAPKPPQVQQPQKQVAPPPTQPAVQQARVEKAETPAPVKPTKNDPDAVPTKIETKRNLPKVNTQLVTRKDATSTKQTTKPSNTKSSNNQRSDAGKDFAKAAQRILNGATPSTDIEMPGIGGGGPSYANYAQLVKSRYTIAWNPPDGIEDENATAKVSITILRDGTVISARITRSSGSQAMDRSIQSTLDRVTFIAPFPAGSSDSQRTYIINFNLKAKLLLG